MTFIVRIFLPEVMIKFTRRARGNLVTFIQIGMHLIECISGHNSHHHHHHKNHQYHLFVFLFRL